MQRTIWPGLVERLFGAEIRRQVRAGLAAETENTFLVGARAGSPFDRPQGDRQEVLEQALEAWRVNPLAHRLVELTSQYAVGGGITLHCKHPATTRFVNAFWNQRLNRMPVRAGEWCDELTRSGNLFILLTTDTSGMSYARAIPASQIAEIRCRSNDIEQAIEFLPRASLESPHPQPWAAYNPDTDWQGEDGSFPPVMLHYAINRPAGAVWGESDLAPLLRWLSRYSNWLEDRARLNRFRTAFLYQVKARFISETERLARQQRLNASPPSPGSILVTDENESWEVIGPKLESNEANTDGLALKKMIAAGAGVPLHFLAEPESATRATAEAAGGPTYRRFEQRQAYFLWLLRDVLQAVLNRRGLVERRRPGPGRVDPQAWVEVQGGDLSARDNAALGLAGSHIMATMAQLRDRGLIDDAELVRLVYRFIGERTEIEALLARGKADGTPGPAAARKDVFPEGKGD